MTHDPMCPWYESTETGGVYNCRCDLIARVRAEEQKDADRRVDRQILKGIALRDNALADLRAKVEGLRDESARELGSNLSRNEISERVGEDTAYAAVLALIDEVR